jgi:hypothetical protein
MKKYDERVKVFLQQLKRFSEAEIDPRQKTILNCLIYAIEDLQIQVSEIRKNPKNIKDGMVRIQDILIELYGEKNGVGLFTLLLNEVSLRVKTA